MTDDGLAGILAGSYEEVLSASLDLRRAQRHDEHEALLRAAVVSFPDATELHLRLITEISANDPTEAVERLHQAAPFLLSAGDADDLTRAAYLAFGLKDDQLARDFVKRASAASIDDSVLVTELVHLAGRLVAAQGDLTGAEGLLTAAFDDDPGIDGHGYWLAHNLIEQGRTGEASEVIERALEA